MKTGISRYIAMCIAMLASPAAAQLAEPEPPTSVDADTGWGVSLSSKETAPIPTATVTVDAPLFLGVEDLGVPKALARGVVEARFTGLPGQAVNLGDVRTFHSVEVKGELQFRIGSSYTGSDTYFVCRGQFATRLDGEEEPALRHPRAYGCGLTFDHRDKTGVLRRMSLIYARSEISSPGKFGAGQIIAEGKVRLKGFGESKKIHVNLCVESHLNVAHQTDPGARDVTRAWVEVGFRWGDKKA